MNIESKVSIIPKISFEVREVSILPTPIVILGPIASLFLLPLPLFLLISIIVVITSTTTQAVLEVEGNPTNFFVIVLTGESNSIW